MLVCAGAAGLGLAQESSDGRDKTGHRVLGADRGRVAIVGSRGDVQWEVPVKGTPHDLTMLPGGNLLFPPMPPRSSR